MRNESFEPKILAPIRMLQVLQEYSDENHLLTYADIISYMDKEYGLIVERKTIQRNLINLQNAGYDIVTTRRGCYLAEREFENSELRLLIDSVLFSKHISTKHAEDLITKLQKLGNTHFRKNLKAVYNVNQVYHSKSSVLFYNIDIIGEAINNNKQIKFIYNEYEIDKALHPLWSEKVVVNPFQLIASNNHYYLVGNYKGTDNLVNFRLEKITDIEILSEQRELFDDNKKNFNLNEYINSHPYMYCGQAKTIKLKVSNRIIGEVIDAFGDNFNVEKVDNLEAIISLKANLQGMYDWAMRMGNYVEVLSPQELRDKIRESVTVMERKYSQNEDDVFNKAILNSKNRRGHAIFTNLDLSKRTEELTKYDYKSLWLRNTNLDNIDFIKNYKALKYLFVIKNPVKDFSCLQELSELQELNITETGIESISFLNNLPNITHLTLLSNPIKDCSPIYSLRNLTYLCMDYNTATTLDLDRIERNNNRIFIKVENPYVVETVVNYKYNYLLMAKKINDKEYELAKINDDNKTYSIETVSSVDKIDENYDLFMMAIIHWGYKKITSEEMGERKLVRKEPFRITKAIIDVLWKQIDVGITSVAHIQRELRCSYGVAANVIDWMIENKYIKKTNEQAKYKVLITKEEFNKKYGIIN